MNKLKFIGSIILLIIIGFTFLNYGNVNSHPTINKLIIRKFISVNNTDDMSDFKNYKFELYKPKLKGSFITESGFFNPSNSEVSLIGNRSIVGLNTIYTEEVRRITPQKWIEHGGFAADVPEVPASLRHFYDPSKEKGKRYLTDKINSKLFRKLNEFLSKPKTNGIDWAIGTDGNYGVLEHIYTWEHGKKYFKGALEQSDIEIRNNYMAKAWRSLGETLHMIADNGCPVHVRNDGHPAFPVPGFEIFGNPDPYEELMELKDISKFSGGSIPFKLRDSFRGAKTAKDIAEKLAIFTNKNFFSEETISGIDWRGNEIKPITNPKYVHKSPKISIDNYFNNFYVKKIGKEEVLLCTDKWYFTKYTPIMVTQPFINEECVESQAKVLIPAIREAGVNVMKLFIPKLKISIKKIDEDGSIAGTIKHETDQEYKKEIFYNGPVKILNGGGSEILEINATGGEFSGQINVDENTNVVAKIEFGGISVRSKRLKLEPKKEKKELPKVINASFEIWVEAEIKDIDGEDSEIIKKTQFIGMQASFKPTNIKNNKINSVTSENHDEYGVIQRSVLLKFKDKGKYRSLNGFSFERTMKGGSDVVDQFISVEGSKIPFEVDYGRHNSLSFTFKGDISKYLTTVLVNANGDNYDKTKWSKRLINYTSPGEIKISLYFLDQINDWNSLK